MAKQFHFYMQQRHLNLRHYKQYLIVANLVTSSNQNQGYKVRKNIAVCYIVLTCNINMGKQSCLR